MLRNPFQKTAILTAALTVTLVATSARADWVTLRDGDVLRGLNLERQKDGYRFTLEDGRQIFIPKADFFHLEKSPKNEKVEFRGKKVSLKYKIATLEREMRLTKSRRMEDVEHWARGEKIAPLSYFTAAEIEALRRHAEEALKKDKARVTAETEDAKEAVRRASEEAAKKRARQELLHAEQQFLRYGASAVLGKNTVGDALKWFRENAKEYLSAGRYKTILSHWDTHLRSKMRF